MLKAVLNEAWKLAPFRVAVVHIELGAHSSHFLFRVGYENCLPIFSNTKESSDCKLLRRKASSAENGSSNNKSSGSLISFIISS